MNRFTRLSALVLACAMTLSLVSCGSSSDTSTSSSDTASSSTSSSTSSDSTESTTSSESASGSVLNVMVSVEVSSLDPQQATDGTSFEVIANYTDGLMQMDADGASVPAAAESYDVSDDGLVYTFYLHEDAVWSNGDPVTADDFIYGWQRAVDPAVASEYSYMLSDIGQIKNAAEIIAGEMDVTELGVTAIDDYTLQVELNVPVSYFLNLMYFPTYYPMNRAFYESTGEGVYGTSPDTVISNGAFILTEYEPAALSFSFVKNEDYYNADSVSLAGLTYQVMKDSQQALLSYQAGDLDIVTLSGDQVDQVVDDPALNISGAGYMWYLTMNYNDIPELDNLNMRLALSNAIDRESIVDDVVKDGSVATFTAVPPDFATGPDGSDFSADQTMFDYVCAYDTDAAAAYWEAAKSELGIDSFTFELLVEDTTESQNVATVIKEQLESALVGLTVDIMVEPKTQRVEDIQNGDYEVCLTRWGPDYADPMTYLNMWITDCSNNYGFWSNAEFDQLIEDCTTGAYITDATARWNAMLEAETLVMEDAAIIPVYTKANADMINPDVEGIEFHAVALNRVYKNTTKG